MFNLDKCHKIYTTKVHDYILVAELKSDWILHSIFVDLMSNMS